MSSLKKLLWLIGGILIAMAIGAQCAWIIQQSRIDVLKQEKGDLIQMASDSGRLAKTYINKYGNEVSKNKILYISSRDLATLRNSHEASWLKQLDDANKKLGNIEQTIRVEMEAKFRVGGRARDTVLIYKPPNKTKGDTIRAKVYSYLDAYNSITVMVSDTVQVSGILNVPLDGAVLWQRPRKFLWFRVGKKLYYSEFVTPNKFVKIKQQEILQVRKKK